MMHLRKSPRQHHPLVAAFLLPALTIAASAQLSYDWRTTGGAWGTAGNWSPAGPPGATSLATFSPHQGSGSTAQNPVLGSDQTIDALLFGNSFLGEVFSINGGGATNDLTVTGAGAFGLPAAVTVRNFQRFDDNDFYYDPFGPAPERYTLHNAGSLSIGTPGNPTPGVALDIGHGGLFALTNATAELNGGALAVHGGSVVLDDRRVPGSPGTLTGAGSIRMEGGGALLFYSSRNGAPSSVFAPTTGELAIGSGDSRVRIYQRDASPTVTFGSLTRHAAALGAVDFSIQYATLPSDAAIRFTTAPALTQGVLTAGVAGTPQVGFATYFGEAFASYDPAPAVNSVVPVGSTQVTGALANPAIPATDNVTVVSNASIAAATTLTVNTLRLHHDDFGDTLTLGVGAVLDTNAILLPNSSTSYNLVGGAIGGTAPRYLQVHAKENNERNASPIELYISSTFGSVNHAVVKAGPGSLVLTGEVDQVAMSSASAPITISGGALRARIATAEFAPPVNFGTSNLLQLRGGVFEVDSSSLPEPSVFERFLGDGLGDVNWVRGDGSPAGSGGFSAYGQGLIVRVKEAGNAAPSAPLVWNGTPGFVRDGHALIFGTRHSSADVLPETGRADAAPPVIWEKPIQLDSLAPGQLAAAREFDVYGLRVFFGDGGTSRIASRVEITRPITGSATTDLVKTGLGQLDLKADNTFTGATLIADGAIVAIGDGVGGQALRNTSGITISGETDFFYDPGTALILGADHQINDTATLTLRNGVFITDVFSEILGSVSLANVIPQFGDGFSILRLGETGDLPTGPGGIIRFADSSDKTWSGLLRIEEWSGDSIFGGGHEQVYFGADPFGLTQAQLDSISFYNDAGVFLGSARYLLSGEIVPAAVPEAATTLFGLLPLLGFAARRRRSATASGR